MTKLQRVRAPTYNGRNLVFSADAEISHLTSPHTVYLDSFSFYDAEPSDSY